MFKRGLTNYTSKLTSGCWLPHSHAGPIQYENCKCRVHGCLGTDDSIHLSRMHSIFGPNMVSFGVGSLLPSICFSYTRNSHAVYDYTAITLLWANDNIYEYFLGFETATVSWWDLCYLETRVPEAVATQVLLGHC